MTGREAFVVGVVRFAKQAGLDQDDAGELVRILLMPPKVALPILKSAKHVQLARQCAKAGQALVSLDSLVKTAFNLSFSLGGGGAASTQTPYQQWLGRIQGGKNVETGAGGLLGRGLAGGLGMKQPGGAGKLGAETDEQMWQRLWEKTTGPGRTIGATPPPVGSSVAQAAIKKERGRIGFMTPQQLREETLGQALPESLKATGMTSAEWLASRKAITQRRQLTQEFQNYARQTGRSFLGTDPTKLDPTLFSEAERPMMERLKRHALELKKQDVAWGGRGGFLGFGQGDLSTAPTGVKTPQEPIGGAGGQAGAAATAPVTPPPAPSPAAVPAAANASVSPAKR